MRNFILGLMLFCYSTQALAIHVVSEDGSLNIKTDKVSHIVGPIDPPLFFKFLLETYNTYRIPGDRVVLINSPGGRVTVGTEVIRLLLAEHDAGTRIVCVVAGEAVSMAFNTLSFCDVRLATKASQFMAHNVYVTGVNPSGKWNPKNLRKLANQLQEENEPFRKQNAKTLGVGLLVYDKFADDERWFSAPELGKNEISPRDSECHKLTRPA